MVDNNSKFTIKYLIEILKCCDQDKEVLIEASETDLFCMIDMSKKKRRGRAKKIVSFEEVMQQRRKNYEKYYGSTAFKYGYKRWSKQEDELIMQHPEENDLILSEIMERSVAAIQTRRWILRKRDVPETPKAKKKG